MRKIVTLILLTFLVSGATIQEWETTFEIENERYFLLKGQIDGQYDITMHLEVAGICETRGLARNFSNRILKGWYYYDRIQTKIPLIGYYNKSLSHRYYDGDEERYPIELYVPPDSIDAINQATCTVSGFTEKFYGEIPEDFRIMNWSKGDKDYSVDLEVAHDYSLETQAYLKTDFNRLESSKINISELTKLKYIEKIELIDTKQIGDDYHVTFVFHERSRPKSAGGGYCGAGIERYLGYLKLGKESSVSKLDFKLNHSCLNNIDEPYSIQKGNPELGIMKKVE